MRSIGRRPGAGRRGLPLRHPDRAAAGRLRRAGPSEQRGDRAHLQRHAHRVHPAAARRSLARAPARRGDRRRSRARCTCSTSRKGCRRRSTSARCATCAARDAARSSSSAWSRPRPAGPVARAWVVQLLARDGGVADWPDFYFALVAEAEGAAIEQRPSVRREWGPGIVSDAALWSRTCACRRSVAGTWVRRSTPGCSS